MEDVNGKLSGSMEQSHEKEKENQEIFINSLVQVVEKYGKAVLDDLDCVA